MLFYYIQFKPLKLLVEDLEVEELRDFFEAAKSGNIYYMKWMLDRGFDIHQTNDAGRNALYFAAHAGQVEVIEWLVEEQGFDVNYADMHGDRAVHAAAIEGRYDALEWLLENRAEAQITNNDGVSPLHRAARISVEMIDLLLLHGADIDHVDNDNLTALHYSMLSRLGISMILHLIAQGANIYDVHGEVIFSQIDRYYAEDRPEYYFDDSSESSSENSTEIESSLEVYTMVYNFYALNQLPGYIEPCEGL